MFTILLAALIGVASAGPPPISKGVTLSAGIGATFDRDPATFRVQLQGELPLHADDMVGLGVVLPLEFTTSGNERFGVTTTNSMFTLVPSVRLRLLNAGFARPYADLGIGLAHITATSEGWFYDSSTSRTGWATRALIGLEVGPPSGGVALVIEPLGIDTLHFGSRHSAGYVARLGVGVRY